MINSNKTLRRGRFVGFTGSNVTILILLSLLATVMEAFGLSIFLPIFQYIRLEGSVDALIQESSVWKYALQFFEYVGVQVNLVVLLVVAFVFFLGRQLFVYLRLVYQAAVTQRLIKGLRDRMFDKYLSAETSYHDNIPVGNLVNAMTTEVQSAIYGVMAPMELIVYLIMAIAYLVILSLLSWEMTLVSIVVLLLASRVPKVWIQRSAQTGRNLVDANTLMSSFLVGRLKSPRLVRLSGTEEAEKVEFNQLTQSQRKHAVHGAVLQGKTEVVLEPVVIGLSLIFLYVAYTMLQMQIEMIGLYLVIALRLMPVVKGIVLQWQSVQRFLGSIEVVEDRFQAMGAARERDHGSHQLQWVHQGITFDQVVFNYPQNDTCVLDGVSLSFPAKSMTALVGPSGSGKSTLIDLIPNLRGVTEGMITIDGQAVDEITLASLRGAIAYAPQNPQIFDGSVCNHIRYGKIDATDEEIERAARLAGADDFISKMPEKYDTLLGEDAVKLSGGQRQRLDLARALVKRAPILILDEPTSNLDAESEEVFHQALRRIRSESDTTIIVVAHRLASVSDADHIVVLKQGRVEAEGRHPELLAQQGWYAEAWMLQEA